MNFWTENWFRFQCANIYISMPHVLWWWVWPQKIQSFCAEMVALALLKVKEEEAWKIAKLNKPKVRQSLKTVLVSKLRRLKWLICLCLIRISWGQSSIANIGPIIGLGVRTTTLITLMDPGKMEYIFWTASTLFLQQYVKSKVTFYCAFWHLKNK